MLKRIVLIIVVLVLVFGGIYYFGVYPSDWADGAPVGSIAVTFVEVGGAGQVLTGTVEISDVKSKPATMRPATAYTADILALNPNGIYEVYFIFTVTFDTDGDATTRITGILGNGYPATWEDKSDRDNLADNEPTVVNQASVFDFEHATTGVIRPFKYYYDGSAYPVIRGADIDGSVFDFSIDATGYNVEGAWSTGSTSGQINIVEGPAGTVTITVDNIDTSVTPQA